MGSEWRRARSLAILYPDELEERTFLVTHSPTLGWSVDVYDSLDSAILARDIHWKAGPGGLLLHGSYATDGTHVFRAGVSLAGPRFVSAADISQVQGVREWLRGDFANEDSIVALLLPELHPEAVVSYAAIAAVTGLKLQTLRTYVHKAEGEDIPFRQFSTEQGHPQWSRPVIAEWAGLKVNPQYIVDGQPMAGVIRAQNADHATPHPNVELASDLSRSQAKELVKNHERAVRAASFEITEMPLGYRVSDVRFAEDYIAIDPDDCAGLYFSVHIDGPRPGPIEWP